MHLAEVSSEVDGKNMADFVKDVVGVFKGFAESELEFKAEIVVPYHTEFTPLLGSFLLVSVTPEDYLLGRITKFYPVGIMSGGEAEDYLARLMKAGRSVPEDVKEAKLRYNVNVKLLGGLTADAKGKPEYRAYAHFAAARARCFNASTTGTDGSMAIRCLDRCLLANFRAIVAV